MKNRLNLNSVEWKEFKFIDIFDIVDGYYNNKPQSSINGKLPFLGATQYNNGITQFCDIDTVLKHDRTGIKNNKGKIYNKNCIAITNNGSVGKAYYQVNDFTCSHDITLVYSKYYKLNKYLSMFLIPLIEKAGQSFEYAKKWRPKRMRKSSIMLPTRNNQPDWQFMEDYMKQVESDLLAKEVKYLKSKLAEIKPIKPLQAVEWGEFEIKDISTIHSGKDIYEQERVTGNIPYITSTAQNNGVGYFVNNENHTIGKNYISVNRNGSVGYAFFHNYNALFSNDVRKLEVNSGEKYSNIFITLMIMQQKSKYGYGYKMGTGRLRKQKILLPISKNNQPDWEYMKNYMRSIEIEQIKKWLQMKNLLD